MGNFKPAKRQKTKTLLISQSAGWSVILKKLVLCATKLEKILQKTAESCGNLNFLTTFAKSLKIKELWQKLKRRN